MFRITVQQRTKNGFSTVETTTVDNFDTELAESYEPLKQVFNVQMYIGHDDKVPDGYGSKKLPYTTSIWKLRGNDTVETAKAKAEALKQKYCTTL